MTLQTLVLLVLKASILLTVFAIGLRASAYDATYLFRRPRQLFRVLLATNVLLPAFAIGLALLFNLNRAIEIALIALAVSPLPPILPKKLLKSGTSEPYAIGSLVAIGLLSIIFVPGAMEILERVFNVPLRTTLASIAVLVFVTIVLPLSLGIAVNRLAPHVAERLVSPAAKIGTVGLLISVITILFSTASSIWALVGNGTLVAMAVFVAVALAIGHFLGGPEPQNRAALAMATASRHPGIAIALSTANFPEEKLAMPAVLLYLLVNLVVSIPYLLWTKRQKPIEETQGEGRHSDLENIRPSTND
jgi:bile acid:Na+ symporter, BASS family